VKTFSEFLGLYLSRCVRARGAQTKSLADFSEELERLASTVTPAVVQVQVSSWSARDRG